MDSNDAAELIAELREDRSDKVESEHFTNRAALMIAAIAAVLAIGGLGGGNATDDMMIGNIRASDTWAFYQAKNIRQTGYEIEVAELESRLSGAPAAAADLRDRIDRYKEKIARYDDEPDPSAPGDPLKGEGKKQLMAQARAFEAMRDRASEQDNNFDYAEVVLQLALVLGSVAILATNRAVLLASAVLGVLGVLMTINGFFLLAPLPF
ncbi:hypothetical protein GCM10011515_25990 [Tsuneonella deserti]|uniref:DUF4337 domain-containing protein n=1 Tax=Tsuneonella deserti TaxID=2035528 RepID=A0ABQ1SCP0_9SPHN|nr:DUF4337 domain-containing protein [Tsuneonella deserti]GGE05236.1 hypothetical protein GCM10011515_25990 [Tsuneonella deserti]